MHTVQTALVHICTTNVITLCAAYMHVEFRGTMSPGVCARVTRIGPGIWPIGSGNPGLIGEISGQEKRLG